MKYFKVFSSQLAGMLIRDGFKVEQKEINKKFPQFDVYCFEDTEEVREAFQKEIDKRQKEK